MTRIFNLPGKSYRLARVLTAMLAIAMFTMPTMVWADETSDTEPEIGAWLKYSNNVATFLYGEKPTDGMVFAVDTTLTGNSTQSWYNVLNIDNAYIRQNMVQIITIDKSFANVHPRSCYKWFYNSTSLESITGLDYLNTEKVTSMNNMFYNCKVLRNINVANFNTNNVVDMDSMFYNCSYAKTLDLTNFNTSNVTTMNSMFYNCKALKSPLDVSHFDTSNVEDMENMFYYCQGLTWLNVTNFNTSKVTSMGGMFSNCNSITTLDVSHFDTSNVSDMSYMFRGCSTLNVLDLTNFNTSNVNNMQYMFSGCSILRTIYASDDFVTDQVTQGANMFSDCRILEAHGVCDGINVDVSRANFTKQWGYFKTYYKVGDTKYEYYGIAPLTVDNLVLEDGADFVNYSTFTATQAQYTRTMPSTYGTLCLPFTIDAGSITSCSLYSLDKVSADKLEITRLKGTIAAGTPVLVYSASKSIDITASNATVVKTPTEGEAVDGWRFKGTFTQTDVPDDDYIISNNKFWLASELKSTTDGSTVKSKGLRAWLTPGDNGGNKVKALSISNGETTGIDVIDALSNGKAEIYDIQGRRIDTLQKGLNIVKTGTVTKKILVK